MIETRKPIHTGGCQCGAVRYALFAEPLWSAICHCRMCQKAFGSYFAPFVAVKRGQFTWTRGAPKHFASSQFLQRGFCAQCGTPLSCEAVDGAEISLSAGSLDRPEKLPPNLQAGIEGRLPWFNEIMALPGKTTQQLAPNGELDGLENRQHPDHDTVK